METRGRGLLPEPGSLVWPTSAFRGGVEACPVGPGDASAALGGWSWDPPPRAGAACPRRPAMLSAAGSPVISRYESSCWSRWCSSCDVELRLFTPGEDDEHRREQGARRPSSAAAHLFRFMEAAAARQGTTTMASRAH